MSSGAGGAQVSAVGLAGVGLPAGSVTQLETLGWGEGVGTGQTLAPCAVSLGPKGSWQSQADPAGNPDGQGLAKCTVARPKVGTSGESPAAPGLETLTGREA